MIVVPRETPWNLIHARNVVTLLEAGAIVLPAIPSFYSRPGSVTAVVDTVVWRILDQIGLPSPHTYRWGEKQRIGETQEKLKIEGWLARWLIAFGFWLLQIWARTLRYEVDDRAGVVGKPVTENYIGALWHNRLLIFPFVLRRFLPNRHGAALISASRDGDLLADAIHRFGYDVVRGSSSRLGASAILQLTEVLASGRDVVITPDGPRGPAYELGPGIIFLAQKSGAAVLPMNLEFSHCWRLGSWDRFIVPRPFSKVRVLVGQPHRVGATSTPEEFEAERLALQNTMMSLVEMR